MEPDGAAIHPHSTFVEVGHLFTRRCFFHSFFPYGRPMIIRITRTTGLSQTILNKVVAILRQHTGPLKFEMEREELEFNNDYFEWEDFFGQCTKYRQKNNLPVDDFLIVLTELNDNNNFFSIFSPQKEDRTVFVHAIGWENYIHSEPENPIAYQVTENILHSLCFKYYGEDFYDAFHKAPIGCINDMCGWKPDISFKLRTGDICPDCMSIFESAPVSKEIIGQCIAVFESVRLNMLFNKELQSTKTFEMNLPFPVAITKRKLSTTLEPLRKVLMLIDHFDSIVRTAVLMLSKLTMKPDESESFFQRRGLNGFPSLSRWVDALDELTNTNYEYYPELRLLPDIKKKIQEVVKISDESEIITMRNEQRGHGYINLENSGYRDYFQKFITVIENIERLLYPFFHQFSYYHVIGLQRLQGNQFIVRISNLSGSNIAFIREDVPSEFTDIHDIPRHNKCYLLNKKSSAWIDLSPYFEYDVCSACGHKRVLVYDGKYMLDPFIGHRFERQKP